MAFVNNHMAIIGHKVRDLALSHKALYHRNINVSGYLALGPAYLSDCFWVYIKEQRELCYPLVEQRFTVYKDKRVPGSCGNEIRPENCLACAWRGNHNSDIVSEYFSRSIFLKLCQLSIEGDFDMASIGAFVVNFKANLVFGQ